MVSSYRMSENCLVGVCIVSKVWVWCLKTEVYLMLSEIYSQCIKWLYKGYEVKKISEECLSSIESVSL